MKKGLLFFKGRVVVPTESSFQPLIFIEFHDTPVGGYAGVQRTLACIVAILFWPKLHQSTREYMAKSAVCQSIKPFN